MDTNKLFVDFNTKKLSSHVFFDILTEKKTKIGRALGRGGRVTQSRVISSCKKGCMCLNMFVDTYAFLVRAYWWFSVSRHSK